MPNGKGSTASPPAGHSRGQQSSQRGPTPPQQRQDDYSQRNNQGYPPQQMNVQGMPGIYPGMVPQQGQPQRIPYFRQAMPRQIRLPQQPNQPMYPSPTSGQQMLPMQGGAQPYIMQQPFVPQQVDYQTVPVGSPQMQYRPPPQTTMGYGNPQMNFPQYSASMAQPMPFVPPGQGQSFMFMRNQQMPQNMGGQPYQQVRQESQPPPRKKNIIKIRDPNQDNKDVTEEILSSVTHSSSGTEVNASGQSSSSNTPPINSTHEQDNTAKVFKKQVADTLKDDKPKDTTNQITKPIQVAPSTSPKQSQIQGVKIISIEKKNKDKVESEAVKLQPKPEEVPVEVKTVEKEESKVDGACVSTENKEKSEIVEEKKETLSESKPTETSVQNNITETTTEKPTVDNELTSEVKIERVPNGSISPSEEIIKPEETKEVEMTPPEEVVSKTDVKTVSKSEEEAEPEPEVVATKTETVESSDQKVPVESSVNGIESEPKVKPTAPATTEPVKRKKNKRFKEFDKKPESDLMDAYRETPVKQEVKEEPEEPKEPPKEVEEEKVPSEDETWEDKDEKSEGIWSPDETEEAKDGPRSYDRDFLLQFQFNPICTAKPEGLPDIEVVLNTINRGQTHKQPVSNSRMGGGGNDFMPSFMRQSGRPNQSSAPQKRDRRAPPKKIVHTIEHKVELVKTENRWVRPSEAKKDLSEDEKKTQEIIRKFRGILNKLTPQKFQTLIQQVLDLDIDTPERLEEIINITFEKAITEPAFSVAYANLCRCLLPKNVKITQDGKDQTLTFRKILLNKCQKEFEKEKDDEQSIHKRLEDLLQEGLKEDELKLKKAELDLEELKGRRRTLGNIRFIGELYKLKMLTESIMHDCIIKLIKSNDEESFECLCKLLSTIGKDLDHQKAKPRMDQYFSQINKIIDVKKTSSRCRFMLQDVVDLRENNWVPRRDENNPKTIDQIHKEVAEEEKKTIMAIQQSRQQKRDPSNKGRDSPRPSGVPQADETWTTVPGRTRNVNVDPKKFQDVKKRTNVDTESISLGPGGRGPGAWARGSSGGGSSAMPGSPSTEEPRGNRFSALGGEGRRGPGASRQGSGAGRQDSRNQGPGRRPTQGDREKALEAVRNVVQTKAKPEDRDTGSPQLEDIEPTKTPTPPPASVSPPAKQLTDSDIQHKAVGIADEYFGIKDLKEAQCCVEELDPSTHQQLVYHCLNHCLEKHSSERLAIAKLMFHLRKNNVISEEHYINGLKQLLEFSEEMEIDIPHVWKYFGELIGHLILDNVLSLKLLNDCIVSLIQSKTKQAKLMAEILMNASKESSPADVGSIWSNSGLTFSIFFSSNDETQQFLKDKNLESIVASDSRPKASESHASNVQEDLRNLILSKKANNEDVFKWIDGNVSNPKEPKFIRALVTAVCEGCRKGTPSGSEDSCDVDLLRQRTPLLKKYIDDNSSLELQALFALQTLAVQLDHPPDFLKSFFNALYDEDLISEDAFMTWEKSDDPKEAQGKGTALSSSVHFFEWLRSAEEEKTEEG